jgi:hypothetical protein
MKEYFGEFLEIIDLPPIFFLRYGTIPSRIYVRHCYRKLYETVTHHWKTYEPFAATLFTGVPGIGKSLFLIYFLFRFLCDVRFPDKRFALEFGFVPGEFHYFTPNGSVEFPHFTANDSVNFECSSRTTSTCPVIEIPIFSDLKNLSEPTCRGKWLLIFSSPNPLRYKQTMSNSPKFRFTFPTWKYSELLFVVPDDGNWIDRFILFGGVPRSVFWDFVEEDSKKNLKRALDSNGGIIADYFFKPGFGHIDPENSYMLIHMNPPSSPTDDDWLYDEMEVYSFASDHIFNLIREKHQSRILAEPVNLFNAGIASEVYGAGNLFEMICLWLKPVAGRQIQCSSLESNKSYCINLPEMSLLEYHWKENARDDITQKLQKSVLYQPKISNLESGNAFCLVYVDIKGFPTLCLVVLQITVGEKHPVQVSGLHDIILAFPTHIQAGIVRKFLVFVTPTDGKLNSRQPLHTQNNKVAVNIPVIVRGFEQCVCRHSV